MKKILDFAIKVLKAVIIAARKLLEIAHILKKKDIVTMSEIEREFKEAEKRKDVK